MNNTPKPTITVDVANPEAPVLTASGGGTTGYQWFNNGVAISGATSNTYVVSGEGSYTVQLTVNGCTSVLSNAQVIIITGDGSFSGTQNSFYLYPNPTSSTLVISLRQFKDGKEVNIAVTDMQGRTIETTQGVGGSDKELNVRLFPSGNYVVTLQQSQLKVVAQFIKSN